MILGLLQDAMDSGARFIPACEVIGLDPRTVQRWKARGIGDDCRSGPCTKPRSAFSQAQRDNILRIANTPEFRDKSPKQIVPLLADRGQFVASESTFYRVLRDANQLKHRDSAKAPTKRHRPTPFTATGPNQVWSWDITYLRASVKGTFYYLYMVLDVWSRMIVGHVVHREEDSGLAAILLERAYIEHNVFTGDLVLHSDNGSPMKGATMLAKLQDLGVATSFSRPSVSNDNPYSESAFRTAKYRPEFPSRPFESLEEARVWAASFVRWYNTEHLHSSIQFVTPKDRHEGRDIALLKGREEVYAQARRRNPERWSGPTRDWSRSETVTLNPAPSEEAKASV